MMELHRTRDHHTNIYFILIQTVVPSVVDAVLLAVQLRVSPFHI